MNAQPEEIVIEVTQAEYEADLARGLHTDEVIPPGRHVFRRGGFLARHGIDPNQIDITIEVDSSVTLEPDVLAYFQQRAVLPNAEPLQTQVNQVLREFMEADQFQAQR